MSEKEIFLVRIDEDGKAGETTFLKVGDILYVDIFSPKKNYDVPRFHTRYGMYTFPLTLDLCRNGLAESGLAAMDGKNLINMAEVSHFEENNQQLLACFDDTEKKFEIAKNKKKYLKGLPIKKIPNLW